MDQITPIEVDDNFRLRQIVAMLATQMRAPAPKKPYNKTVQIYSTNQSVPIAKGCFAWMFTNVGDTTADVEGMVIFPSATPATAIGDSRTISGHENDIYTGNITISFRPPLGSSPAVELVQLYYV